MDISKLWTAWPVANPWQIFPLHGGTNSRIWRVEVADGQSYVLRLTSNEAGIRYEAALLSALSKKQLPFLLPLPLRAHNDDILVPFEQEAGTPTLATLSSLLPGSLPERNDPSNAFQAALTLARLHSALAELPEFHPSNSSHAPATFGELTHCHPLVPDPLAAIERLPIDRVQVRQIRAYLTTTIESIESLTRLPQQLLHRDYDPNNILMDNQKVSAVLDFEFAATDIRILDLCIALSWWPVDLLGSGKEWSLIDTFGGTYINHFPLSEEELRAIPAVLRLRDVTSLVHRIGRYFAGQETDARMQDRVMHSFWREEWLSANHTTLLEHALKWL